MNEISECERISRIFCEGNQEEGNEENVVDPLGSLSLTDGDGDAKSTTSPSRSEA